MATHCLDRMPLASFALWVDGHHPFPWVYPAHSLAMEWAQACSFLYFSCCSVLQCLSSFVDLSIGGEAGGSCSRHQFTDCMLTQVNVFDRLYLQTGYVYWAALWEEDVHEDMMRAWPMVCCCNEGAMPAPDSSKLQVSCGGEVQLPPTKEAFCSNRWKNPNPFFSLPSTHT